MEEEEDVDINSIDADEDKRISTIHLYNIPSRGSAFKPLDQRDVIEPSFTTTGVNPLYGSTVGIAALFSRITVKTLNGVHVRSTRRKRTSTESEEYFKWNQEDGSLLLDETLPLLANRFKFVSVIDTGTFSQLVVLHSKFKATQVHSQIKVEDTFSKKYQPKYYAVKIMNLKYNEIGHQESHNLKLLNNSSKSSHCVTLISTFTFAGHFCLTLELLHHTLLEEIQMTLSKGPMSMKTVRKVAIQLIQCLFYLKNEGFIHADLKPENILMTGVGANLTVCDFGNAVHVKDANIYYDTFEVQSLFYRAPEVVIGLEFNTAIDMWSVGCILAEMLLGTPLFSCRNNAELLESMMDVLGPPPLSYSKGKFYTKYFTEGHHLIAASSSRRGARILELLSLTKDHTFIDFLLGLLEYDPKQRFTPMQALSHSFFHPLFPFADVFGLQPPTKFSTLYEKLLATSQPPLLIVSDTAANSMHSVDDEHSKYDSHHSVLPPLKEEEVEIDILDDNAEDKVEVDDNAAEEDLDVGSVNDELYSQPAVEIESRKRPLESAAASPSPSHSLKKHSAKNNNDYPSSPSDVLFLEET